MPSSTGGEAGAASSRPLSAGLRRLLIVAGALVSLAWVDLFFQTEQTDEYFAWTVQPALTAASLGAAYGGAAVLEFLAARERTWARARISVPGVLVFTWVMLAGTVLHVDRFHFDSGPVPARIAAWGWIAIYVVVPPLLLVLAIRQLRLGGPDPPPSTALPRWLRAALGLEACVMLVLGIALFVAPDASGLWPWSLTPLTGRAVAAWLIGIGVLIFHLVWENDWSRVRIAIYSLVAFGALELIAVARYANTLAWSSPSAWIYVLFLFSLTVIGLYGSRAARRAGNVAEGHW